MEWTHAVGVLAVAAVLAVSCSVRDVTLEPGAGGAAGAAAHGGGGTGGTSPGGGGVGPGGGGTGGTGGENCLNGIDDDHNGHTDCDDTACQGAGYVCVPSTALPLVTPPSGTCGPGTDLLTVQNCSACSCQPSNLGTCHLEYSLYASNDCTGAETTAAIPTDGACQDISAFSASGSPTVGARAAANGDNNATCTTNSATEPATDFALCGPPQVGGGCGGTDVCVPPSTFSWCQLRDAGSPCATPYYFDQGPVFANAGSTCSCHCGPGDPDCTDTPLVTFANVAGCMGSSTPIAADGGCHDLGIDMVRSYRGPNGSLAGTTASCPVIGQIGGAGPNKRLCCLSDVWP